jgi:ribonuclease P protein component
VHPLRRKTDIHRVLREGRRFDSPCAVLYARQRTPDEASPPAPRLAVVTRRGFGKAVLRNRARRRLRETLRVLLGPARMPWDMLLIATPETLSLSFADRMAHLSDLLCRAGIVPEGVGKRL